MSFQLRYVLLEGRIDTEINRDIAWSMLGPGLAQAREMLSRKTRRNRPKVQLSLNNKRLQKKLALAFQVVEGLQSHWKEKDCAPYAAMLDTDDDAAVAETAGVSRGYVYNKRRYDHIHE